MRLRIPMTGTVIDFDPECYLLDGIGIGGDDNDPVRPVNLNLGGISWHLVSIDLENDLMEVEAEAPEQISEPVLDAEGKQVLEDGKPKFSTRPTTPTEKQQILANAQHILESMTADEIYALTGDKRLVKPVSVMEKYIQAIKTKLGVK